MTTTEAEQRSVGEWLAPNYLENAKHPNETRITSYAMVPDFRE
jgi:hypothetical protein